MGQPDLGEDVPAHCRGSGLDELRRSLPTQTVLRLDSTKLRIISYLPVWLMVWQWISLRLILNVSWLSWTTKEHKQHCLHKKTVHKTLFCVKDWMLCCFFFSTKEMSEGSWTLWYSENTAGISEDQVSCWSVLQVCRTTHSQTLPGHVGHRYFGRIVQRLVSPVLLSVWKANRGREVRFLSA